MAVRGVSTRRIVLCGPPLAGKTTLLNSLAASHDVTPTLFEPQSGSGEVRDRGVSVITHGGRFEFVTVCGAVWNEDTWPVLATSANGLALVLDRQEARAQLDRDFVERIPRLLPEQCVRCVVWTKGDLIARGLEKAVPDGLLSGTSVETWPSFATRSDRPDTLLKPLAWLAERLGA